MTKILFVSHGINDTGWGQCTKDSLLALSSSFDVVSRHLPLGSVRTDLDWWNNLEAKSLDGVTHVLQYVLPQHYEYYPNAKNIGITEIENNDLHYSQWLEYYEMMDHIVVSNEEAKEELCKLINTPVSKINHCLDLSKYKVTLEPLYIPEAEGTYKFYCIAENTPRKNLQAIIKAFHIEFDPSEPVSLILKTGKDIGQLCNNVKMELDMYPDITMYHKELTIVNPISETEIYRLHQYADCYVSASTGESFGRPVYDSQGFGNVCVVSDVGGHKELCPYPNLIKTTNTIGGGGGYFKHTENARTISKQVDILDLAWGMRSAYDGKLENINIEHFNFNNYNEAIAKILATD